MLTFWAHVLNTFILFTVCFDTNLNESLHGRHVVTCGSMCLQDLTQILCTLTEVTESYAQNISTL